MFVEVYDAVAKSGHADPVWLTKAYADLEKDYEMWNRDPHVAGDTGLSRYYDFGECPPPEAVQDETGFYRKVATYFFFHPVQADGYILESRLALCRQPRAPLTRWRSAMFRIRWPVRAATSGTNSN